MIIIQAGNEQVPLEFGADTVVIVKPLATGDYSVDGFEDLVCVEWKAKQDFIGTMSEYLKELEQFNKLAIKGRFMNELDRMVKMRDAGGEVCIISEISMKDIRRRNYRGDLVPNQVLGAIMSIQRRYKICVHCDGDRDTAKWHVYRQLMKANTRLLKEKRKATPQYDPAPMSMPGLEAME